MRRREFITLLGGAATAGPRGALAQQNGAPRVAALMAFKEDDPEEQLRVNALREGLQALGWREQTNIQIDWRFAAGDLSLMQRYASELINLKPTVILAENTPVTAIRLEVGSLQALPDLVAMLPASQTMTLRSVENGWPC
jgi:putative ABC transport system substrate-binding protein